MIFRAKTACAAMLSGVLVLLAFAPAHAGTLTLTLESLVGQLDLTGSADVALLGDPGNSSFPEAGSTGLAADGGPVSLDGWGFLNVDAALSESDAGVSTATSTIVIDNSGTDLDVTITTALSVFFDLTLTDRDDRAGRNFADGLGLLTGEAAGATGNTVTFSPGQPLDVDLVQQFQVACSGVVCLDPLQVEIVDLGSSTVANEIVIPLVDGNGAPLDMNGNAADDSLKFSASSFLVDIQDVQIGDIEIPDDSLLDVLGALLDFATGGDGAATISTTIGITSGSLDLDGKTFDSLLDPPWTIQIAGSILEPAQAVPEPATLALLGLGLAGIGARRRTRVKGDAPI